MASLEALPTLSIRRPEAIRLWQHHARLLEQQARGLRDPVAVARLHHQRGFVLQSIAGDVAGAIRAWMEGFAAFSGHLPTLLALRDAALLTDDQPLARRLFDALPEALARSESEAADVAEMYTFFALAWRLRWPDEARAAQAVRRLDAVAPDGDGDVLAPLVFSRAALALRLERRIEAGARGDHLRALADLRAPAARRGVEVAVRPLLAEAAARDPYAALRWIEEATAAEDVLGQAEGMEALARFCGPYKSVLRFLAGELWDLLLDDGGRATAAYADTAEVAVDRVIRIKEVLRRTRREQSHAVLAQALEDLGRQVPEDPCFSACLLLRAASLHVEAGAPQRAWEPACEALATLPDLPAAQALVAWLGVGGPGDADSTRPPEGRRTPRAEWPGEGRTLRALADALAPVAAPPWRRLRAAVLELASGDAVAAEAALGRMEGTPELGSLRMRQRLLATVGDPALGRAWQREAAQLAAGDRRTDLFLRIGHRLLTEENGLEKALTYLFWVLDEPDQRAAHFTALRLLFEACRAAGRRDALIEVSGKLLNLLEDPADRLPVQRAVAEAWAEADPPRAAAVLEQIWAAHPHDGDTLRALEALYERLDRRLDLTRVLQEALRSRALAPPEQARVALRLGRLLEHSDPGAAKRVFADALELAAPGSPVHQALEAGMARLLGLEDPTTTVHGTVGGTAPPSARFDETRERTRDVPEEPRTSPLPRLTPLPALALRSAHTSPEGQALLTPLGEEDEPITQADAVAPTEADGFLGEERTRAREEDPGRAIIARKLRQAQREPPWPDLGRDEISLQINVLETSGDPDERFDAASALAEAYQRQGELTLALRALRTARGFRADDARTETQLEAVVTALQDWPALADLLAARLRRIREGDRRRPLLVQLARLRLVQDDPARAVEAFQEAVGLGERSVGVLTELANALKAVRRYPEYVEVLTLAGLAEPEAVSPADALTLGRVFLYRLQAPERAVPFILRAARVMTDRVDVAADLAWARAAAGDIRQGVRLLEQAIAAAAGPEGQIPRQVLRVRLARLYETLAGDPELARRAYREALRDGVRDPAVLERVERLATEAGDAVTLVEVLRRAFEEACARREGADVRRVGLRLGRLLIELDQPHESTQVLLDTYVQVPEDEELFRAVADGLRQHPDGPATIRLYGTRLGLGLLSPADRRAAGLALVAAYEALGRVGEAADSLSALRAEAPDDPEVRQALERIYPRAGRWPVLVELYQAERAAAADPDPALLRKLARALEVGVRDLPGATEVWQGLVERDPKDLEAVRAVARLLEAQKRWSELLWVSQREVALVSDGRQKAYIHFRIGTLHETHLGDLEAAQAAYRTALKLDPRCFPALHGLRTIATDQGDWPRVLRLLETELGLWDDARERAAVLARIGDVQARHLGQDEAALASYRRAVDLWPGCVPAVRALADAAFAGGRFAEAAPLLQTLTQQKLDAWPPAARCDLFYKRGAAAFALGRVVEAIESLTLALEFVPDHFEALSALVKAVGKTNDFDRLDALMGQLDTVYRGLQGTQETAAQWGAARTQRPAEDAGVELARIDILRGHVALRALRLEQAATFYQAAATRRPRDLEAQRPLVTLHVRARRWTEATAVLRRFAEGLKSTLTERAADRARFVEALLLESDLWCDGAADPGRAIECCRRVLQVDPHHQGALFRMAQAHFLKQEYTEAREVMQRLTRDRRSPAESPREHALHVFYLGRILEVGFQDAAGATEAWQRALQLDAHCASALLALLRHHGRQREWVDRLLMTHAALLTEPDEGDPVVAALRIHVAGIRLRRGDGEGARALLAPLADGGGPRARDARFALVQVGLAAGQLDEAARPLYRVLDENISDSEALRALADILARKGDDDRRLWVLSALELVGALPPEEQPHFEALTARARQIAPSRVLTDDVLERLVAHPAWHSPLLELAALLEPALIERFPLISLDIPPPAGRRHPLAPEVRAVQGLLGVRDLELHLSEGPELMQLRPGVLLLGGVGLTTAHQRFVIARAVAFARAGLTRLHDLAPERALELFGALAALFEGRGDTALLEVPRKVDAQRLLAAHPGPLPTLHTGESVLSGLVRTTDRLALLATGRLRPAVEALLATPGEPPRTGDLTWALRSRSRLQDLVKYALSDACHQARQALGLAI